jgi:hypothetical protein
LFAQGIGLAHFAHVSVEGIIPLPAVDFGHQIGAGDRKPPHFCCQFQEFRRVGYVAKSGVEACGNLVKVNPDRPGDANHKLWKSQRRKFCLAVVHGLSIP